MVGDNEAERAVWRERARVQVAFYGSTPNYAFIFEQLDREDMTDRLRERQRAGDVAGMAAEIDDDILENFVTEGRWDDIADKIVAKYGGIATRVVSYFTGIDVVQDPAAFERWGALARQVRRNLAVARRRSPSAQRRPSSPWPGAEHPRSACPQARPAPRPPARRRARRSPHRCRPRTRR